MVVEVLSAGRSVRDRDRSGPCDDPPGFPQLLVARDQSGDGQLAGAEPTFDHPPLLLGPAPFGVSVDRIESECFLEAPTKLPGIFEHEGGFVDDARELTHRCGSPRMPGDVAKPIEAPLVGKAIVERNM